MTCPIKGGQRETPTSFRQFKDDLNSSPSDQKYCCGDIDTRFCCSLDEKLKELPDFDPIRDDDDGHQTSYHSSWYDHLGFWSWLMLSSLCILLFGMMVYLASCIFVEILDMVMYVLCCCFCRGYRKKRQGYEQHSDKKEYRPAAAAAGRQQLPSSSIVQQQQPSYVRSGGYQTVTLTPPPPASSRGGGYGGTNSSGLYQNVTPSSGMPPLPPPYQEKA